MRRDSGCLPAWLVSGRHVRHDVIHVGASNVLLVLAAPTARARIVDNV